MKKTVTVLAFFFYAILFSSSIMFAQQNSTGEWIRISSDNGEFSIEVPAKYNYFFDEDGFWTSKNSSDYKLEKMSLLNAYHENTLLSLESYKSNKGGLEAIYESDTNSTKEIATSEFKRNGVRIRQVKAKTDDYFLVKQYFNSKTHIYILTAASRTGENPTTKRFLDSLVFKPDTNEKPDVNAVLFSSLKITPIDLTNAKVDKNVKPTNNATGQTQDDSLRLLIVSRSRVSYTEAARMRQVKGVVQLRPTFSDDGFIHKIEILKPLPEGLLRQAVFAALRIKFLPEEKAKKPVSTTRIIEYSFSIY